MRNATVMKEIALNSTLGVLIRVKIQILWFISEETRDRFISSHFSFTFLACLRNNTSKGVSLNILLNIESADRWKGVGITFESSLFQFVSNRKTVSPVNTLKLCLSFFLITIVIHTHGKKKNWGTKETGKQDKENKSHL